MKKFISLLLVAQVLFCSLLFSQVKSEKKEKKEEGLKNGTNLLGGLTPKDALEYMKKTQDLVIIEVNTAQYKKSEGFIGAMWIPHNQMEERCGEIPKRKPVLLHCGLGVVSVPAYKTLIRMRPDIPELSYIDGAPLIKEYNEWKKKNKEE